MGMNTLYGKTMAIWMLAGRSLAAIIFFLVGFVPPMVRYYKKRRQLQTVAKSNDCISKLIAQHDRLLKERPKQ